MTNEFEKLKNNLKELYPDEDLSDAVLNDMTDRLITFFAIGAKALFETKKSDDQD